MATCPVSSWIRSVRQRATTKIRSEAKLFVTLDVSVSLRSKVRYRGMEEIPYLFRLDSMFREYRPSNRILRASNAAQVQHREVPALGAAFDGRRPCVGDACPNIAA